MILQGNVYSELLNMHTGINVLVPEKTQKGGPCKTAYLLHGLHGNSDTWLANTMLPVYAKEYDVLFIMPEVGRSFYTDMKRGLPYFTYVRDELPEICRQVFNISGDPGDTAVIGCSMGAYGALRCAFTKPEQYGFCGSISGACLFINESLDGLRQDAAPWLKARGAHAERVLRDFYAAFGDDLRYGPEDLILPLIEKAAAAPRKPKLYAACGDGDEFYQENLRFRSEVEKFGIDFTFEDWPGDHDWYFFSDALKKALEQWLGK
ncbi:MAG: esterase family protein [Treponema sp.]|nr:esterase family protein [Treponema sp.]